MSSDGTNWPDSNRLLFDQTAVSGAATVNVRDVAGDEYLYLAWTDLNQQIHVTMTTNARFGDLPGKVVPLQVDGTVQTAVSCPGLSTFNSGEYASPDNVAIVWPGTDGSHHTNLMTANVANTEFGYKGRGASTPCSTWHCWAVDHQSSSTPTAARIRLARSISPFATRRTSDLENAAR